MRYNFVQQAVLVGNILSVKASGNSSSTAVGQPTKSRFYSKEEFDILLAPDRELFKNIVDNTKFDGTNNTIRIPESAIQQYQEQHKKICASQASTDINTQLSEIEKHFKSLLQSNFFLRYVHSPPQNFDKEFKCILIAKDFISKFSDKFFLCLYNSIVQDFELIGGADKELLGSVKSNLNQIFKSIDKSREEIVAFLGDKVKDNIKIMATEVSSMYNQTSRFSFVTSVPSSILSSLRRNPKDKKKLDELKKLISNSDSQYSTECAPAFYKILVFPLIFLQINSKNNNGMIPNVNLICYRIISGIRAVHAIASLFHDFSGVISFRSTKFTIDYCENLQTKLSEISAQKKIDDICSNSELNTLQKVQKIHGMIIQAIPTNKVDLKLLVASGVTQREPFITSMDILISKMLRFGYAKKDVRALQTLSTTTLVNTNPGRNDYSQYSSDLDSLLKDCNPENITEVKKSILIANRDKQEIHKLMESCSDSIPAPIYTNYWLWFGILLILVNCALISAFWLRFEKITLEN